MLSERAQRCGCGHGWGLHDQFGCAAFLGAFTDTAGALGYCRCRLSTEHGIILPCLDRAADRAVPSDNGVVAVVTVRERPGSAVGFCELPPALEFGVTADEVVSRVLSRLRGSIARPDDGSPQSVRVVRDGFPERVQALG